MRPVTTMASILDVSKTYLEVGASLAKFLFISACHSNGII